MFLMNFEHKKILQENLIIGSYSCTMIGNNACLAHWHAIGIRHETHIDETHIYIRKLNETRSPRVPFFQFHAAAITRDQAVRGTRLVVGLAGGEQRARQPTQGRNVRE